MPTRSVGFNRPAIRDYDEASKWYAERSEEVFARFVDAVDTAVQRILDSPNSWPAVSGKYRRVSLDKFPHSLIFFIEPSSISESSPWLTQVVARNTGNVVRDL
jgi:hypothetical protein